MAELISKEKAITALRKALYKYENEKEEEYIKNKKTGDWFLLIRPSVQDMNDIDVETINSLPSENPWHTGTPTEEGWYLLKVKSDDEIIYDTNRLIQCLWGFDWQYVHEEILEWQKINDEEEGR